MRTRLTVPALLVMLLLGLAACGSGGDDATAGAAGGDAGTNAQAGGDTGADQDVGDVGAATGDAGSGAGEDGASAGGATADTWAFTARTLEGEDFDGSAMAGTPAVLWFWAPWCPTCRGQASTVAEVADRHAGEVNVIGIAGLDDSVEFMREFVAETGTGGFTHLADPAGEVWQRFEMTQQSTYVLIDASGTVVHSGFLDNEQLVEQVERLAA